MTTALPPPPNGQVLSLVSALLNPENHDLHVQAIRARDEALSASSDSYNHLCLQLGYVLAGSDDPAQLLPRIPQADMEMWRQTDPVVSQRMMQQANLQGQWIPFGQMAGLILKQALLRPPVVAGQTPLYLESPILDSVKETLLYCLSCRHAELRAVASTVIATTAVSRDSVQPFLYIRSWPTLIPTLVGNLQQSTHPSLVDGSLSTLRMMLEDNANELDPNEVSAVVAVLFGFLSSNQEERYKVAALQSLISCLEQLEPEKATALLQNMPAYIGALSNLASDPSPQVRKWVCRSIVTLLEDTYTEHLHEHFAAICQFMLQATADIQHDSVALEACEFWLTFASLPDGACTESMFEVGASLLPQLIPVLLHDMVYTTAKQEELLEQNRLEFQEQQTESHQALRPVFHTSRAKHAGGQHKGDDSSDESDDEDGDGLDDDEGNEWTVRKCAAASLDTLASVYGAEHVLPHVFSALQHGLTSHDPWVQEASILALGAIAEGCEEEMSTHMGELLPYLMNQFAVPETINALPQVKCVAAWTIGRYSTWIVEQVRAGVQEHLLGQLTEIFVARLGDRNRRVQVASCAAFGTLVETAGELMTPYLEPVFRALASALQRYQGYSLLMVLDVIGALADFCGPSISDDNLPSIYVPTLLQMMNRLASNDPADTTLLPLMESLASIAKSSGANYQPYTLESFENAMQIIESVTLILASSGDTIVNEEEADPIVCALDLLDGLAEGMSSNFPALVSSSRQFSQHFLSMLHGTCKHEIAAVRMSALALLGDIAHNAPSILEPALPQLLQEAVSNMDPIQPSVSLNAVWALGEIFAQCGTNTSSLEPVVPALMQNLIALLTGNGVGSEQRGVDIPGLPENAAACVGRLAKVNPNYVAPDLSRFLLGWCDGMAKIMDPTERRDAFQGFVLAVNANPQFLQQAAASVSDTVGSILFAIVSWHVPSGVVDHPSLLHGEYKFQSFPQAETALGTDLVHLVHHLKAAVGDDTWNGIQQNLPQNVLRLLQEEYHF